MEICLSNINFNELLRKREGQVIGVTCITDNAVVSRLEENDKDYHHTILARILSDVTGDSSFNDVTVFRNDEYKDYCLFIRYIAYEDYAEVTIELPNSLTKGIFVGLKTIVDELKNTQIDNDYLVNIYVCDEEFNVAYNPTLGDMKIKDMDLLVNYLSNKVISNEKGK